MGVPAVTAENTGACASGTLRDRLIGAWKLVDVVEEPADGPPVRRPHGEEPTGLILYTADGHVSVQIMDRGHGELASRDWSALAPIEYAGTARGYFAYAGRFDVDEEHGTVTHSVSLSLFPGWIGGLQVRAAAFEGSALVLSSATPAMPGGKLVTTRLTWERA
jgi:hypothetical protein